MVDIFLEICSVVIGCLSWANRSMVSRRRRSHRARESLICRPNLVLQIEPRCGQPAVIALASIRHCLRVERRADHSQQCTYKHQANTDYRSSQVSLTPDLSVRHHPQPSQGVLLGQHARDRGPADQLLVPAAAGRGQRTGQVSSTRQDAGGTHACTAGKSFSTLTPL